MVKSVPQDELLFPMDKFHLLIKDFYVWSQDFYPGEVTSYFDSLGPEFKDIEKEFDHARSCIISLLQGLSSNFYTHPRNAIQNNLDDLIIIEEVLYKTSHNNNKIEIYMTFIEATRSLLNKAMDILNSKYNTISDIHEA
ncbi:hypothetical protein Dalu01_01991 [Deinococcus aluminii]|uniref:Four helix bundle protein n=1 Tax=Deinococcus aluminii TaxID=1656885 RepID=A0ABP9XDY9_9DEIO